MSKLPEKCLKCGGTMVSGILSVEGTFWKINWRLKKFKMGEEIVAFRCKECGYTELYSI